ncbi:hypothetical protein [Pseudoroseomonas cervicalis]|uniref:hypothetical protein n=1 Tax=Teichococcus cervicalis TaxID=204525 RepID=UPI0022F1C9AA|nr:hypothetical protein [Pseudoroseomonas cervicalis]WBV43815.1 hypothetical protein PFY06_04400 [Pseudoroseomonas cervicalis]
MNETRIRELAGERRSATNNNFGMLLAAGPLALDLNDTQQREAEALQRRNVRLVELAQARGCPAP